MLPLIMGILGPILGKVVDTVGSKLGVDMDSADVKEKKLEIALEIQKLAAEQEKAVQEANVKQIEVNIAEAQNANIFVAGWRPFIGWMSGFAMGYHFILQPLLAFVMESAGHHVPLPSFDMQSLITILMGMLGLGAMRTYEKVYGVARDTMAGAATAVVGPEDPNSERWAGKAVYDEEAGGVVWKLDK